MKIRCPHCDRAVPPDQINMGADLAYCSKCEEAFRISGSAAGLKPEDGGYNEEAVRRPPSGAWFRERPGGVAIGATTRSAAAFLLVPFMCVWSGGSLGGIYGTQIAKGRFDLFYSLFGIPFILGSFLLWGAALMAVCGKVEVRIGRRSEVFTGVGPFGVRKRFDWTKVERIYEAKGRGRAKGGETVSEFLALDGAERVEFGSGLSAGRRYFILNALRYLKANAR